MPPGRLRNLLRAFPVVALALVGAIMTTQSLHSERMELYPFNVNRDECAPCYCHDGRLTECPKLVGEVTTKLYLNGNGELRV